MELTTMKNIGSEMNRKLTAVGVTTAEELISIGSKSAFLHLKTVYPEICLVHLYALQGAIDNIDFNMLPQDVKDELKAFRNSLK